MIKNINRRKVQVLSPCVTCEFASTRTCQNKETTDQKSGTAKVQMEEIRQGSVINTGAQFWIESDAKYRYLL